MLAWVNRMRRLVRRLVALHPPVAYPPIHACFIDWEPFTWCG